MPPGSAAPGSVERGHYLLSATADDGGEAHAVAMDVTDERSVERAFDDGEARFGPIDGVVANAGISGEGPAIDLPVEEFDRVFATNVRGVFLTARTAARRTRSRRRWSGPTVRCRKELIRRPTQPSRRAKPRG